MDNRSPKPSAKREDEFTRNAFPALSMKDVCSISNGFPVYSFLKFLEVLPRHRVNVLMRFTSFLMFVAAVFIVGEDDSGRRGSVRGRQCHHHALYHHDNTIMTMNTNVCRNVHSFVTSL